MPINGCFISFELFFVIWFLLDVYYNSNLVVLYPLLFSSFRTPISLCTRRVRVRKTQLDR